MKTEIKARLLGSIFVMFLLAITIAKADIYMGTCEGYIKWLNGSIVPGANVTVTVQGCTTPPENCQRSVLSQSNGYYVVANLNLPPYGNVTVTALKGSAYGTNTGQADAYQAAYVNVTLCESPSSPVLVPVNDSHYPNITFWFNWTSGSSPYPTFDQWYWQGSWQNASSPQTKTNLAFANYTWGARTCLSSQPSCCSAPAYDNFSVYNSRPCKPILQDQPNTNQTTVTLNWTSNTTGLCPDADNDTTYYNFKIDSTLVNNATPPQIVSGLGYGPHQWQVQECDPWECSDWAIDTFSVVNEACPAPTLYFQNNTCENQVLLSWDSADQDPDGDPCTDEFRIYNNAMNITISPATPPQSVTLTDIALYTWGVRSCDDKGACSPWIESSFIYCNCGIVEEVTKEGKKIYRSGACVLPAGYELVVTKPKEIHPGDPFELKINLKYFKAITNLTLEAETPEGITIEPLEVGYVGQNQEINLELKGSTTKDIQEKKYTIFIKGYDNQTVIINKPIEIEISMPPPAIVSLLKLKLPVNCCSLLFYLLLLIFLTILAWLVRKTYLLSKAKKEKEIHGIQKIKEEAKKI